MSRREWPNDWPKSWSAYYKPDTFLGQPVYSDAKVDAKRTESGNWTRDQWVAWWDDMPDHAHETFSATMGEQIAKIKAQGYEVVEPPVTYRDSQTKLAEWCEAMGNAQLRQAQQIRDELAEL